MEPELDLNKIVDSQEKAAASPEFYTPGFKGKLVASKSGWLLLEVPNSLMRGMFDSLHEIGTEIPKNRDGNSNAHISVMTADEVEQIGGPGVIKERGRLFSWKPVGIYSVKPRKQKTDSPVPTWKKVWFLVCRSKELQDLRKSYGLSELPYGSHKFHITFAVQMDDAAKRAEFHPSDLVYMQVDSPIYDSEIMEDFNLFEEGDLD